MPNPILHQLSVAGSVLTSTLAAWRGTSVLKAASQPAQYLKLYDIEGCPDCRSVREALTALLFLTYAACPTPRTYQSSLRRPLLDRLASSVRGQRGVQARAATHPRRLLELWSFESSPYARLVRERLCELELPYVLHNIGKEQFADMGPAVMRVKPGPYKPRPGGRREKVLAQLGRIQVPYLEDPNTGTRMYESGAIIDYLEGQYAS